MKIETNYIEEMTIEEFAEKYDLTMEICEREITTLPRFYASFKGAWVSDGNFRTGAYGDGNTPEQAIKNYAIRISCQSLKIESGHYIKVPRLK